MAALLAAEGKPVLFHCRAGKDRTGFAAAITLRLLGAPPEAIAADYRLSGGYALAALRPTILILRLLRGKTAANVVRELGSADARYLQAAFDTIDGQYGSFDRYARDGLGLDERAIARLRDALLEG